MHRGAVERGDDAVGAAPCCEVTDESGCVALVPLPAAIDHRGAAGNVLAVGGSQKRSVLHLLEERRVTLWTSLASSWLVSGSSAITTCSTAMNRARSRLSLTEISCTAPTPARRGFIVVPFQGE